MKKFSILTLEFLLSVSILEQHLDALTLNGKNIHFEKKKFSNNKTFRSVDGSKTIIVKFNSPLTRAEKNRLYTQGVDSIVYSGDLSYYIHAKNSILNRVDFSEYGYVGIAPLKGEYKLKRDGMLDTYSNEYKERYHVLFLEEMDKDEVKEYFRKNSIYVNINRVTPQLRMATIYAYGSDIDKIKELSLVQYIDKDQSKKIEKGKKIDRNAITARESYVNPLWGDEYNLNGENMSVGVVDGGVVLSSHKEFTHFGYSRVIDKSNSEVNFHATHVAGTIGACGVDGSVRGMANRVKIYSYSFTDISFGESFLKLYNDDGVLFSNHSYGYNDKIRLGEYDSDAATQDRAVSENPFLNAFEAAGNDGKDSSYPDFGFIKGPGNSKNILTVGALNINSSNVATLSSKGPVFDGRIKPDLCVRGEYVKSTSSDSDDSYAMMSGTSMATPAATGIGILIAQEYKRVTGGYDIRHDILKSVLINTAVDKENKGPDYKTGFGMIDAKAAVDLVKSLESDKKLIVASKVSNAKEVGYDFEMKSSGKFKATLSWIDPEANPASKLTLVNDLDLVLVNKQTGKIYYPYTLDKDKPNNLARQDRANRVDNIEQIEVDSLPSGSYLLKVVGHRVISDSQEFCIASNTPISGKSSIKTLRPSKIRSFVKTIQHSIY